MRNISDESCRENQNTHFIFNNFPFPHEIPVFMIYVEKHDTAGRPQLAI